MTEPLRVGVVGLGDIAQKAYLPVLAGRSDITLALMSRNAETVARISRQYGVAEAFTSVDDLLDNGVDAAFVHASTQAHVELVERLLSAGVHVLVDKPLAPDLADARRLVELAEKQNRSLAVGFNRRFCPAYASLPGLDPSVILMQKNRVGLPDQPRRLVFDDFIHVVDTLRFFLPAGEEQIDVWCSGADCLLQTITVALRVQETTALGVMHRLSGADEEILEVLGDGYKHRVVNLADVWRSDAADPGGVRLERRGGWTTVPTQRGFTAMCGAFIDAVRARVVVSARDALRTHEICEAVVCLAEARA